MKTCIVFRCHNIREKEGRGLSSALECIDNWKKTIFDVIDCDIVFFTYASSILHELIERLSPKYVCISGEKTQDYTSGLAITWMNENKEKYDRFVLLRFDFMYRKKITDWTHWEKKGIVLVNKDVHHPRDKVYADIVFVVDSVYVSVFKLAFETYPKACLHHIGRNLEQTKFPFFYLMYPDYYAFTSHPLHTLHPTEPEPDLNDNYEGEKILDVSKWNEII